MNTLFIQKSQGSGTIVLPPSKSHTQRAILLSLMAQGTSCIENYLISPDTQDMLNAICQLGAVCLYKSKTRLQILGTGGKLTSCPQKIWAGNSGQVLRFVGAFAALTDSPTILVGDAATNHNRLVEPLLKGIAQLGGFAKSLEKENTAPILIKGPIHPGKIHISGQCSQPVSAFLMACSFLQGPTEIIVEKAGEKPWIALTLYWMRKLGLGYEEENLEKFLLHGYGKYQGFCVTIPGDLSSAAFPVIAALITGSCITVKGADLESCQGDGKLFQDLIKMGAKIVYDSINNTLFVEKGPPLSGGTLEVNDYIDAVPILGVLGCFCKNPLVLTNAQIARKKESDRLSSISHELKKMGALIHEEEDSLTIYPSKLQGCCVQSWKDHRIAMALCCAGLGSQGITQVQDIACIDKSYPHFYQDFAKLGFDIDCR